MYLLYSIVVLKGQCSWLDSHSWIPTITPFSPTSDWRGRNPSISNRIASTEAVMWSNFSAMSLLEKTRNCTHNFLTIVFLRKISYNSVCHLTLTFRPMGFISKIFTSISKSSVIFFFPQALKQAWTKQTFSTFIHISNCGEVERAQLLSRPGAKCQHSPFTPMHPRTRSLSVCTCIMNLMRLSLQRVVDKVNRIKREPWKWKCFRHWKWSGVLLKDYIGESSS